jgi:hypothetical protein
MPATLPPFSSTSFGHFSAKACGCRSAITKRIAQRQRGDEAAQRHRRRRPVTRITSVRVEIAGGLTQGRARRPRPPSAPRARIQAAPSAGRRRKRLGIGAVDFGQDTRPCPGPSDSADKRFGRRRRRRPSMPNRFTTPSTMIAADADQHRPLHRRHAAVGGSCSAPKYMK